MPEYDRQQVEARLEARLREIEKRRAAVRRSSEGMRDELADYDQHPADQGTETFEQELDETTLLLLDDEEERVKAARRALEDGTYGVCIDCGREIPPERLEAMPESIRCIEHQNLYEARLRQASPPATSG
jgi:RNA polymerase-binding transcription factor DksA